MGTIKLELVTPYGGQVFSHEIEMLIVRSTAGELGILPKHANLLTELLPHAMRVKADGTETLVAIGGGFMEVTPDKITILADSAELAEGIDVERAKSAYKRAEDRIAAYKNSPKDSAIDIKRAEAALARAKARLLVKNVQV